VIVITGPGRSGTSLVAQICKELGVEPGGVWNPSARAGFEDRQIVLANRMIIRDLGVRGSGRQFGFLPDERIPSRAKSLAKSLVPESRQRQLRSLVRHPPWRSKHRMDVIRWDRFNDVVANHRERLRSLAVERPAAKDPAFCWTLGVWGAAGASIDHVVVAIRSLDAMAHSRASADWLSPRSLSGIKNWFAYGFGLLMSAVYDHRLSYGIARFPDFLNRPDDLYRAIRFPHPVTYEAFLEVFRRHVKPDFVHDRR
jgi:hypothetical protein